VSPTRGTTTWAALLILTILSLSSRPSLRSVRFRLVVRGSERRARSVSQGNLQRDVDPWLTGTSIWLTAGHHGGAVQQVGEVVDHQVADPDGAYLPVGQQGLQRPVEGRAWCRMSRSIWSTPSLRADLSKP
jgi:hypothetical protein